MKKLLLIIPLSLTLQACDWNIFGEKEGRSVRLDVQIMDEKVDFYSIHFFAYRNDTKVPLGVDSIGHQLDVLPKDKKFPYRYALFGLPFTDKIEKVPKGYYEVEVLFNNGAKVRKKFGEIKGKESHLNYLCFISGDSTVELHSNDR